MKNKSWVTSVLIFGGVAVAAYVVYRMYVQKRLGEGDMGTQSTTVDVNDPNAKKPRPVKVNVPSRFV